MTVDFGGGRQVHSGVMGNSKAHSREALSAEAVEHYSSWVILMITIL